MFELTTGGTEIDLYDFGQNSSTDGRYPVGLTMQSGNLYGTTYEGGTIGGGTVFELMPQSDGSWKEEVLYSFNGPAL